MSESIPKFAPTDRIPMVEVTGDAGRIKINKHDLAHYESQGYQLVEGSETERRPGAAASQGANEPAPYDFKQHNFVDLKRMAMSLAPSSEDEQATLAFNSEVNQLKSKEALINWLVEKKFDPRKTA